MKLVSTQRECILPPKLTQKSRFSKIWTIFDPENVLSVW